MFGSSHTLYLATAEVFPFSPAFDVTRVNDAEYFVLDLNTVDQRPYNLAFVKIDSGQRDQAPSQMALSKDVSARLGVTEETLTEVLILFC